jgi:hypothetical protein
MFVLNPHVSFLMKVLKALASMVSMCSLHVTLLSKDTPWYFALFTNGVFLPCNVRNKSGSPIR